MKKKCILITIYFPEISDCSFLVMLFQNIDVLHWIYTANENQHISYQSINSDQKDCPGSNMN